MAAVTSLLNRVQSLPAGARLVLNQAATIADTVRAIDAVSTADSRRPEVIRKARELKSPANILGFVHSHFAYQPDQGTLQTVRTWQRINRDKRGNCVDFTTAISSLLKAAGISHKYRVTDYGKGWAHIYPVVPGVGALDAVTVNGAPAKIGNEQPYTHKRDYMPQLAVLNGPAADIARTTISPLLGNKRVCRDMYTGTGGAIREAFRAVRSIPTGFTFDDVAEFVRIAVDGCNAINCIWTLKNDCNRYIQRNQDQIFAKVLNPGDPNLTVTGGGGTLISSGPRPGAGGAGTSSAATLAGVPVLPLALLAAGVLLTTKKKRR